MGLSDTSVALSEFVTQIDFNNRMLNTWLLVGVTAAGFFVSCMCMVTSTAISREGSQYFTMKYLPAPYRTQLNAKAACGILVSCSSLVVLAVFLQAVFRAPLPLFAGGLVLVFPGAVFMAYLGLLIDLIKPKLKWENEQQAVKQNFNSLFLLMAGCGISLFLVIFGMVLFAFAPPHTAFVCLLVSSGTMAAGMYLIVLHVGGRIMHRL
jgi:ABC-2 type transport system permease protein